MHPAQRLLQLLVRLMLTLALMVLVLVLLAGRARHSGRLQGTLKESSRCDRATHAVNEVRCLTKHVWVDQYCHRAGLLTAVGWRDDLQPVCEA